MGSKEIDLEDRIKALETFVFILLEASQKEKFAADALNDRWKDYHGSMAYIFRKYMDRLTGADDTME